MKKIWVFLFLPFMLWAQRLPLALAGDVAYLNWYPHTIVFDTSEGWKSALVRVNAVPSFGGHIEYSLDDTWSLHGRLMVLPVREKTVFWGDFTVRWYGDTPAPEGVGVGGGLLFFFFEPYVSLYPQFSASYKWVIGNHFFLEPEVCVFPLYYELYLGLRLTFSLGWIL